MKRKVLVLSREFFLLQHFLLITTRIAEKYLQLVFSRRFRKKARLLQWLVFFRQFNAIGPLFLLICSTSWPTNFLGSEKQESVGSSLALNHIK